MIHGQSYEMTTVLPYYTFETHLGVSSRYDFDTFTRVFSWIELNIKYFMSVYYIEYNIIWHLLYVII